MPDPDGQRPPYAVHASGAITEAFLALQRRATRAGQGEQVLSAMRDVHQRLAQAPFDFGEPLYRLPVLRMQVRCGLVAPLAVHFGVCEDRPVVFIKGITLISDLTA